MELTEIKKIIIAGAGVMGASLAQIFAEYDYDVTIYDIDEKYLDNGRNLIKLNQETNIKENIITKEESDKLVNRIKFTIDKLAFKEADFILEAITENMKIKKIFWEEVSNTASKDTIFATNTSGLSITEMATAVKRPERFCGMHWVNPPHIVPLVEVTKGEQTSDEIANIVYDLAIKVGKKPVLLEKELQGFLLNRFQFAILREALSIVESGAATTEDIDNVFKYGLGMRYACLGPFQIADLGGLDTFANIASYLFEDLSDAKTVSPLLANLAENESFGVKSKKGFYDYSNGADTETINKRDKDFLDISKILYGEDGIHA